MMIVNNEVRMLRRPEGKITHDCFEIVRTRVSSPKDKQVLVKNLWMSVDPYMRLLMQEDTESSTETIQPGKVFLGGAVGEIIDSRHSSLKPGDFVLSDCGWREYFIGSADTLMKVDHSLVPLRTYLGVAGLTGMTAWTGLLKIGQPRRGETVFVTAASGAVGSVVCQLARSRGCYVAGCAGTDAKVDWLCNTIGIDAAFNYRRVPDIRKAMAQACPNGIDVYFENVGGEQLEAALDNMNDFGRVALCGLVAIYDNTESTGPGNLIEVVLKSLRVQGFDVTNPIYWDEYPKFLEEIVPLITDGTLKWKETVYEGIEMAPDALIALMSGNNIGKMLVKLADTDSCG